MATTTPNFGWPVPTSGDLVKNGATAIEALGDAIDASLVDLEGGTTGQVLAKASNADMDFAWVAQDDSNAIQNSIVDAKGDLIAASAADTPARLAVGPDGSSIVADSSTSTGLRYRADYAAGKNKIINGDFGIWQRGTSFTSSAGIYTADRWSTDQSISAGTRTITQQTFTPGTAPVAGYEGTFFLRLATSAGFTAAYHNIQQKIEDVRVLAGQTATISFWAKADSSRTIGVANQQSFGSGGSGFVATSIGNATLTTSWQRFTFTYTVPSISGKTIGTGNYGGIYFDLPTTASASYDFWGVQLEAGSVATAFQTATGTIQGELSAAQRYYYRTVVGGAESVYSAGGTGQSSTATAFFVPLPVPMRITPASVDFSTLSAADFSNAPTGLTNLTLNANNSSRQIATVNGTSASGITQYRPYVLTATNANGYVGFSAEL
jgi:hypothetical protein